MPTTFRTTVLGLALGLTVALNAGAMAAEGELTVFVGTYTGTGSKGIYRFEFDPTTGAVSAPKAVAESVNPSFLAIDPTGRFLYAVSEIDTYQGVKGGAVQSFAIDPNSRDLIALNAQSSGGAGPCHLVVDKTGKNVLVANYGGGSVAVLPVGPDGRLGARSAFVQHTGAGVNPERQKEPHAHSVNLNPANRFAFVADLGLDKMLVYAFDPAAGTLTPGDPPSAQLPAGAGPRHFAFHPTGKFAYTINELNSTVTAWSYDRGALNILQNLSTLPAGFKGANYPADVHVHPSGNFLYGSNRGHDSIVAYRVDPASGALTLVGHQGRGIKNPRNFAVAPDGRFLLVANQDLNTVAVFRIDPATGALTPTGNALSVPKPVCLQFWAATR